MSKGVNQPVSRWELWWRWTGASTVGAFVAVLLYVLIPQAITYPKMLSENYDYLAAPWRYVLIYGVIYGAFSMAQWWILRRYITGAWQWPVLTVGSAALLFPAVIWLFHTFRLEGIAAVVWSPVDYEVGFGGHLFAITGQWWLLRHWTRLAWPWLVLAPIAGITAILGTAISTGWLERWLSVSATNNVDLFLMSILYNALTGIMMAGLLTKHRRRPEATPQVGLSIHPTW